MMYTMSKIFSTLMTIVVVTTVMVGRMTGTVILQNETQALAPSTDAASSRSAGTFLIAAERIVIQKPVDIHTPTIISATVLMAGSVSHETGWPHREVTSAFSSPIWLGPEP